jgi:CSLREA domain-containing protein
MNLHPLSRTATSIVISVVAGLLLLFALGHAARANPTTVFGVNTTLDEIDDNVGNGICHTATNHCSLRAAVMEANNGSGDTILVPAGTYTLTLISNGDLELRQDTTLDGAGPNQTIIQGDPTGWNDRILRVRNNAHVTVNGVTIRYGHAADFGGGIYVVTGTLALENSAVVSNTADQAGGGIYNGDQLTLTLSTIMSNSIVGPFGYYGGGVYNAAGSFTYLTRTLIQGNVSWGGTGFYNDESAQAHLNFSTISSNRAITGGAAGLWNNGIASLTSVTVTNNVAAGEAGGIYNGIGANAVIFDPFVAYNTSSAGAGVYNDMTATLILAGGSVNSNTTTAGPGGGVFNNSRAKLTILAVDISHNQAQGLYGDGGGVFGYGPLVIEDSNLSANSGHYGGGISSHDGLTLTLSTLANNSALEGGGLDLEGGGGSIDQSTFSDNTAMSGGGISAAGDFTDQMTIDNSTFSGNIANDGDGGGLINFGLHLQLTNDTLSNNQALNYGGGIANVAGFPRLNNVTIAGNMADSDHDGTGDGGGFYNDPSGRAVDFYNTLIAGNVDTGGQTPDCAGELTSKDHNLIQSMAGCTITGTTTDNITGKDALLGPLQNNGGSTWTRALLPGSPAIDAGTPGRLNLFACAATDQRDVARPIGPQCDIGAYEANITLHVYLPLVRR